MRPLLAAALGGALLLAAAPPLALAPLGFVALVPLLVAARAAPGAARAAALGWLAGALFHVGLLAWLPATIARAQAVAWPTALAWFAVFVGYHALQFALALPCARLGRTAPERVVVAAAGWVCLEWAFPKVFPWSLGATLGPHPLLRQGADLFGAHGLAGAIVLVNALLAEALIGWAARPAGAGVALAAAGLLLAGAGGYGAWRRAGSEAPGGRLRLAAVQVGAGGHSDADPRAAVAQAWLRHAQPSAALAGGVDLVVWPESALPVYLRDAPPWRARVEALARALDAAVVLGALDRVADGGERTAAYAFAPSLVAVAPKVELVPFGEYVPRWLPLGRYWRALAPRRSGPAAPVIDARGNRVAARICFEAIRPGAFNAAVRAGATLLLNPSDDSWFASPSAAAQHLEMTRLRAVETRRWLVRASASGISAVVDPRGAIVAALPYGVSGVLRREVALRDEVTPYARWGDAPLLVVASVVLAIGGGRRARAARHRRDHPRSNTSTSASASARRVTLRSSLIAAPSPAPRAWPLALTAPRATCTQAWRLAARAWVALSPGPRRAAWISAAWWMVTAPSRPSRAAIRRRLPRISGGNGRCSYPGARPARSGRIQICSRWTGSVFEALNSLWRIPVPALMRWISPGRISEPLPRLSRCSSTPSST